MKFVVVKQNSAEHRAAGRGNSARAGLGRLALAGAFAAAATTGCWRVNAPTHFHADVDHARLQEPVPAPAGKSVDAAPEINANPEVKIDPTKSEGYESLPAEIKELYGPSPLPVRIEDIVVQTLEHDRTIKIQNYSLQIAEANIPISKCIYDLAIRNTGQARRDNSQTSSIFSPTGVRRSQELHTSVDQLLPSGANLQLFHDYTRQNQNSPFQTINPIINHAVGGTLSQPLLRGFGPTATNADIHIAQVDRNISAADFEGRIQTQLGRALRNYWELVYSVEAYNVQVISYTAALDLLRINQAKEAAGVLPPTEVLQARARAETRREAIIQARQTVRDIEDQLKQAMFFQEDEPAWSVELRPCDDLSWREVDVNMTEVFDEAYANRPELRSLAALVDRRDLEIIKAKDQLKPQLDLFGTLRYNGVGRDRDEAYQNLEDFQWDDRIVGFEFSAPLQNRRARHTLQQTQIGKERTLEDYRRQRDTVTLEVRNAVRALRTARERIDVARARIESEQANLSAEQKRYEVGVSTSFQVLQFQDDLASAQQAYARAVVDDNQAFVNLEQARGSLLETFGVDVQTPDLRPVDKKVLFPIGFN